MERKFDFGDRLKQYRELTGYTLETISKKTGLPNQTLSRYELKQRVPKVDIAVDIAEKIGVNPLWMQGYDVSMEQIDTSLEVTGPYPIGKLVNLPMIASVKAGFDGLIEADIEAELVAVPVSMLKGYPPKECVTFRVKGDSMYPRILEGDIVIVHLQTSIDSGQTAIVIYNGEEGTLKRVKYVKGEDWLELIPFNPEYPTKRIEGVDVQSCRVYGHVIGLQRSFD